MSSPAHYADPRAHCGQGRAKEPNLFPSVRNCERGRCELRTAVPGTSTVFLSFKMPMFHVTGPVFSAVARFPADDRRRNDRHVDCGAEFSISGAIRTLCVYPDRR